MAKYSIGLDLSYSNTGVVILGGESISCHGFKAGKSDLPFHERANDLWKQLQRVLPKPNECSIYIEGAAYGAEYSVFMLGELSGAVKLLLYLNGYSYRLVPPPSLKKYATGSGNASKAFVAAHVTKKWDFINKSDDIVDAFVLAKMAEEGWISDGKKGNKKDN